MRAIISIHDVMPHTLPKVARILERMPSPAREAMTLLIVPGLDWSADQLRQLRDWQQQGHLLAGHGWRHEARHIRGLRHWLHASLLSRSVAEHLALKPAEIAALLDQCHRWFAHQDLPPPDLYVPPAWALGKIDKTRLKRSPFRHFETMSGIYDAAEDRFTLLPLLGFEADTMQRAGGLKIWNGLNGAVASTLMRRPARIAIHPHDLELPLAASLLRHLQGVSEALTHRQLL